PGPQEAPSSPPHPASSQALSVQAQAPSLQVQVLQPSSASLVSPVEHSSSGGQYASVQAHWPPEQVQLLQPSSRLSPSVHSRPHSTDSQLQVPDRQVQTVSQPSKVGLVSPSEHSSGGQSASVQDHWPPSQRQVLQPSSVSAPSSHTAGSSGGQ